MDWWTGGLVDWWAGGLVGWCGLVWPGVGLVWAGVSDLVRCREARGGRLRGAGC